MARFKECREGDRRAVSFKCPGCGYKHVLPVEGASPTWGFNGDMDRPTLTPSIHVRTGHYVSDGRGCSAEECGFCNRERAGGSKSPCTVCHSFVTNGRIQFLGDCTHALAGQTVDLPELGA